MAETMTASHAHDVDGDAAALAAAPESMVQAHRGLWDHFGKFLLGNIIVIAVILILMAIFLV